MNIDITPQPVADGRREKAAALRFARKELREAQMRATLAEEDLVAIRHVAPLDYRIVVTP